MKSEGRRIGDASDALERHRHTHSGYDLARLVLEAADREPPMWPTEQSVSEVYGTANIGTHQVNVDAMRRGLRAALLADPIIQAAIAYRDTRPGHVRSAAGAALLDAVNEAGL